MAKSGYFHKQYAFPISSPFEVIKTHHWPFSKQLPLAFSMRHTGSGSGLLAWGSEGWWRGWGWPQWLLLFLLSGITAQGLNLLAATHIFCLIFSRLAGEGESTPCNSTLAGCFVTETGQSVTGQCSVFKVLRFSSSGLWSPPQQQPLPWESGSGTGPRKWGREHSSRWHYTFVQVKTSFYFLEQNWVQLSVT